MLKLVWRRPRTGNQAGNFSPLVNPSLLHISASRQRGVGRSRYCWTSPSLRWVLHAVHDCFVDRHKKRPDPSKGQEWRLNKWPCISGNKKYKAFKTAEERTHTVARSNARKKASAQDKAPACRYRQWNRTAHVLIFRRRPQPNCNPSKLCSKTKKTSAGLPRPAGKWKHPRSELFYRRHFILTYAYAETSWSLPLVPLWYIFIAFFSQIPTGNLNENPRYTMVHRGGPWYTPR